MELPFGIVNAPGQRYHPTIVAQAALAIAHDQWRTNVFAPPVCGDLEMITHFDEIARTVRPGWAS